MSLTRAQFVERLTSSNLLSAADLAEFERKVAAAREATDAQVYARLLVQHGKLTKYQAAALYQGKTKGLVLGNYVLLDKLGAGGMGQVFKALHRRMDRVVALKVLPAEATKSPENVKRFHREVKAAARLEHPNIVAAHDADEADGTHFLVMQYVEGKDLSAIVKENGPFPVVQAVECIRQAAQGLAYAHKRGVIHRDIKPANLLLAYGDRLSAVGQNLPADSQQPTADSPTIKILDMGLARLEGQLQDAASVAGLTQSGQVMGTVDYMSPEQAEETRGVDARADQYSLGCTLWVLLTGRPMFGGTTTIAKLMAHRTAPIPSLRAARADVPEALEAVYQRMVAKEPDERYASMDEVIAALAKCLGDAPPSSLDGPSSTDSRLTDFFQQIAGTKTAAPPKSVTAVDEETQQLQPAKQETGTELRMRGERRGARGAEPKTSVKPLSPPVADPASPAPRPASLARQRIHPLALAAGLGVAGISSMGLLLALVLWFMLPEAEPAKNYPTTNVEPAIATIDEPIAPPPLAVAPFDAATAKRHQQAWADYLGLPLEKEITLPGGQKLTMMLIPPGEFLMGSTAEDRGRFRDLAQAAKDGWSAGLAAAEGPQHAVQITQPFYLGKFEVTQAQWQAEMGSNPANNQGNGLLPVERVSWDDIQPFLAKINDHVRGDAGMKFTLPTEAQWEYACRAGTTTQRYCGDNEAALEPCAWFTANARGSTQVVGQRQANSFGVHDMLGNVWEWCADVGSPTYYQQSPAADPPGPASGSQRVFRGGSWFDPARGVRSANRIWLESSSRNVTQGFRLAATIDVARLMGNATNYALDFDGSTSYVEIPTLKLPSGPLTVEAWITPRKTAREAIFHSGGESFVSLHTFQNSLGFWREAPSYLKSVNNSSIRPGMRQHVAGVWDGKVLRAFVNGQGVSPGRQVPPELAVSKMLAQAMIGGEWREGKLTGLFDGQIDELRVSTTARYTSNFNIVAPFGRMQADKHTLALYHFDEGAGEVLRDSSGNAHDGKIVGAKWIVASPTPDAKDFALSFDGRSCYVTTPVMIDSAGDFTFEARVRASDPRHQLLVSNLQNTAGGASLEIFGSPTNWNFSIATGGKFAHVNSALAVDDKWHHLAGVKDGSEYRLFVDGRLVSQQHVPVSPSSARTISIGASNSCPGSDDRNWVLFFAGELDEIRISTIARYTTNFRPPPTHNTDNHTLALYHFDEGQGDVLRDSSKNNHHGKILGAKWVQVEPPADHFLQFDGASYVTIPSLKVPSGPFTVESRVLVGRGKTRYIIKGYGARTYCLFADGGVASQFSPGAAQRLRYEMPQGEPVWRYVTGVWDGREARLYIDGQPVALAEAAASDVDAGGFWFGAEPRRGVTGKMFDYFDGALDEVRVSSIARYTGAHQPQSRLEVDEQTLALYHFDEGAGNVLRDSSGNNHHGRIVGAKWVQVDRASAADLDSSLEFTRDERVELPALPLAGLSEVCIEAWVVPQPVTPGEVAVVFNAENQASLKTNAKANWDVVFSNGKGEWHPLGSPQPKVNGRLTHVAGVLGSGRVQLYVDGKRVAYKPAPFFRLSDINKPAVIGGGWEGSIQQLRVSKIGRYYADFTPVGRLESDANTIALYHFNEGAGDELRDTSGNDHHGKIVGAKWVNLAPPAAEPGFQRDQALEFDGVTSKVELRSLKLDFTKPLTYEAWVWADQAEHRGKVFSSAGLPLRQWDHRWSLGVRTKTIVNQQPIWQNALSAAVAVRQWQHLAGTWDAAKHELALYVDGKLSERKIVPDADPDWQLPNTIGFAPSFQGRMAVLRISTSVRYAEDFTPPLLFETDPQTLALYQFDEGQGEVLRDSSGNNHHGKIVEAKWVRVNDAPTVGDPTFTNEIGVEFIRVPRGKAWVGDDVFAFAANTEVEIADDYYLGRYEVTQAQWQAVMGENPSHFSSSGAGESLVANLSDAQRARLPVENVSWTDAQTFIAKLNERHGVPGWVYRLPTENEWEIACRGGTGLPRSHYQFEYYLAEPATTLTADGANVLVEGSKRVTKPVGSYLPNGLGFYDMHGNVHEWCQAPVRMEGQEKYVRRSSSFADLPQWCGVQHHSFSDAEAKDSGLGMRLALVPTGTK